MIGSGKAAEILSLADYRLNSSYVSCPSIQLPVGLRSCLEVKGKSGQNVWLVFKQLILSVKDLVTPQDSLSIIQDYFADHMSMTEILHKFAALTACVTLIS